MGVSFLKHGLGVSASLIILGGIQFAWYHHSTAVDRNSAVIQGPNIDIEGLILNWDFYLGDTLDIEGKFECLTERFCDFVPTPSLSRSGWVDVTRLTSKEKLRLELFCHDVCDIRLRGQVNPDDITAWDVLDIRKK